MKGRGVRLRKEWEKEWRDGFKGVNVSDRRNYSSSLALFFSWIGRPPSLDDIVGVDSVSSYVPRFVIQSALVVPQFRQLYNRLINHADVFCAVGRCVAEANSHGFFFLNAVCGMFAPLIQSRFALLIYGQRLKRFLHVSDWFCLEKIHIYRFQILMNILNLYIEPPTLYNGIKGIKYVTSQW